jgi:type IV secretory pathway protease TraF
LATRGLPPSSIVLFDATGTSANEIANTAPTRPPRTRVGLAAVLPACLERLERISAPPRSEDMVVLELPASTAALIAR